jgi:hypothetical protein
LSTCDLIISVVTSTRAVVSILVHHTFAVDINVEYGVCNDPEYGVVFVVLVSTTITVDVTQAVD